MEAYRKAKDFEEKQQYDDALESLLESLQEPTKNNPKRESAIKDVAAILHKLGSTQKAIEFLYKHRFEMANVPQFLNFTANLMFQIFERMGSFCRSSWRMATWRHDEMSSRNVMQCVNTVALKCAFEPRPDDAYPRVLVIKPPYEFAQVMCIKECEALVFEMFKYHRFKIESVVINEDDEDGWRTIHVVFETHSSARKAALHWSKSHLDQLLQITWPNEVPIDLVDKKDVPERMIVETGIDAGAFADLANSHEEFAPERCKILLITPERLKLATPDHSSSTKTEAPLAVHAQPEEQKRRIAAFKNNITAAEIDSDGIIDSEVDADNEMEVEKIDALKLLESNDDYLVTWGCDGDNAKAAIRNENDAQGSGYIDAICTSANNVQVSDDNDNEDVDASPRLPKSLKCGFAVPEQQDEEENHHAIMAVPTPYPTKTTRFARTSPRHSRGHQKYEYVPKDSVVRFQRMSTPHPTKYDTAAFENDAATKSKKFHHSPTPHPKKADKVAFEDCGATKCVQFKDSPASSHKKTGTAKFEYSPTPHPKKTDNAAFEDCAATKSVKFKDPSTPHPKKTGNVKFRHFPSPHSKRADSMAFKDGPATKFVRFEYSPTPHPNKYAEAAGYRFEHPSTPHPRNSSTSGYEADVDWDTQWDNRVWSRKHKNPRHAGRREKLRWSRKESVE